MSSYIFIRTQSLINQLFLMLSNRVYIYTYISRPKTPLMTGDDCDAAVVKVKAKHENESRCRGLVAAQTPSPPPPPPPPPTEAEIEAFFAAAELAERRRFAEA